MDLATVTPIGSEPPDSSILQPTSGAAHMGRNVLYAALEGGGGVMGRLWRHRGLVALTVRWRSVPNSPESK